jgi:hypothetical protein
VADTHAVVRLDHGVASEHAKSGFEGSYFVVLGGIWHVVDCHAAILLQTNVCKLWDALVGAVLGRFEIQRRGPVVAEVFAVGAACAGGFCDGVVVSRVHLVVLVETHSTGE